MGDLQDGTPPEARNRLTHDLRNSFGVKVGIEGARCLRNSPDVSESPRRHTLGDPVLDRLSADVKQPPSRGYAETEYLNDVAEVTTAVACVRSLPGLNPERRMIGESFEPAAGLQMDGSHDPCMIAQADRNRNQTAIAKSAQSQASGFPAEHMFESSVTPLSRLGLSQCHYRRCYYLLIEELATPAAPPVGHGSINSGKQVHGKTRALATVHAKT